MGLVRSICVLLYVLVLAAQGTAATLIRNALIVDGSGGAAYSADLRIDAGQVAAIGQLRPQEGDALVEAAGLVLAPGFIDAHSHHDDGLDMDAGATSAISQGITTIVVGQDGESEPLLSWRDRLASQPVAINVATLTGHGSLRDRVLGKDFRRPASREETAAMAALLAADLDAGSLGLSTGLEYDPGIYADTGELIALARTAAAKQGIYVSHIRSEDVAEEAAIEELLRIGREADIPVHISHLKIALIDQWGEADNLLARLDIARAAGVRVSADAYPYTFWHASLTTLFPRRDFDNLEQARFALAHLAPADGLRLSAYQPVPQYVGMTVAEIAAQRHSPPAETMLWLIQQAYPEGDLSQAEAVEAVMGESMHMDDVDAFLSWPQTSLCSDGATIDSHPRAAGAFTHFLRQRIDRDGLAGLPQAVQAMSARSASNLGLGKRGRIVVGWPADLVLFDPATVRDRATLKQPMQPSAGILAVWVNGQQVWDGQQETGARPGQLVLRSPAA